MVEGRPRRRVGLFPRQVALVRWPLGCELDGVMGKPYRVRVTNVPVVVVLVLLLGSVSVPCGVAQETGERRTWSLRIVAKDSGAPLRAVVVRFPEHGISEATDAAGLATGPNASGLVQVLAAPLGYVPLDTMVTVPEAGGVVEVALAPRALELSALTVEAERAGANLRPLNRMIFNRDVVVGAVSVTQSEVTAVPPVAEADVFRSLQSFVGVTTHHDMSAEVFVRGGSSDQVGVRLDGAPVFSPHHMFGLFGAFNSDIIESVELYQGSLPARYGGSLSGMIWARQRAGAEVGARISGGVSVLGLRATAEGSLPWADGRWLVAGRQASVDVAKISAPYSFHDLNLGLQLFPAENHRIRFSSFNSDDRLTWGYETSLDAEWANSASSLSWSWVRDNRLTINATAYHSNYRARMAVGPGARAPVTNNRIDLLGLRGDVAVHGDQSGVRTGFVLEGGPLELYGSRRGAYMEGRASGEYLYAGVHAEFEQWFGPVRLVPGFRAGVVRGATGGFVEPRIAARYHGGDFAVSVSLDRTSQFLSVLRDDRYVGTGASIWFLHDRGAPASVADGVSVSVDGWLGEQWTGRLTGWARRLNSVPSWRPSSSRDRSSVVFENGRAYGWEASLTMHATRVRGWFAYQYAKVDLTDDEDHRYHPRWDRRHEIDATLSVHTTRGLNVLLRTTIGSGTPFWFPAGVMVGWIYSAGSGANGRFGAVTEGGWYDVWSKHQGRFSVYARTDAAVRRRFRWGGFTVEPYLSVVNLFNRDNLGEENRWRAPTHIPRLPFIGVDFEF